MFEWLTALMSHGFLINSESEVNCESEITDLSKSSRLVKEIINLNKPFDEDFFKEKLNSKEEVLEENLIEQKIGGF